MLEAVLQALVSVVHVSNCREIQKVYTVDIYSHTIGIL